MSEPILRDAFNGWEAGVGIFSYLRSAGTVPWSSESVDDITLDLLYFGDHSGGKFCSPIVKYFLTDGEITPLSRVAIAKMILAKYLNNWNRLWEVNSADYNPIHNYNMTETRVLNKADSETEIETEERSDGTTVSYGKGETTQHGKISTEMDYKYGINTPDSGVKPSDKATVSEGGDTVVTDSGEDTTDYTLDSEVNKNKASAGEENETTTKSGNIGVTTTQKMIQEEREIWKWNYFENVFKNLDEVLALKFHDPCRV